MDLKKRHSSRMWIFISVFVGVVVGARVVWLFMKSMTASQGQAFKNLASEALRSNNDSFLTLAKTQLESFQALAQKDLEHRQRGIEDLVRPVKESLERVDQKIQEVEQARARADESIFQQVRALMESQRDLKSETSQLVQALRAPQARGRWGEIQLKRVVEMAGMLEHCDFFTQESTNTEDGRLRPDLIVKLPGGKRIVVDAKAPLMAFLDSMNISDPNQRQLKLAEHSRYVRRHIEQLGRKAYWDQFSPAPEFVALFLPGENFFSAALEQDPSLIEFGVTQNVIVATPTTLIALLRSVAYGWRQEKLAENARLIGDLGRDLYKRLSDLGGHFSKVGKNLEASVDAYNKAVGTLETRVFVTARKFKELDSSTILHSTNLEAGVTIDQKSRALQAPELDKSLES